MAKKKSKAAKKPFDKYEYYSKAVQSPDTDVVFLRDVYKELRGRRAEMFREDFCGTFALSCEWVKLDKKHRAVGIDLDPEPVAYGLDHYFPELSADQQARLKVIEDNVMSDKVPHADIVAAMNFSYFIFKTRELMKEYFENVYRSLNADGVFVLDLFGGSLCYDANEEKTKHKTFTYYWDQKKFDPVSNFAEFAIHFRVNGGPKRKNVFTYDWRMWSIPELKDILMEVGFKKCHVYWEGTTKSGGGNGKFKRVTEGESCQSWIAYIAAER